MYAAIHTATGGATTVILDNPLPGERIAQGERLPTVSTSDAGLPMGVSRRDGTLGDLWAVRLEGDEHQLEPLHPARPLPPISQTGWSLVKNLRKSRPMEEPPSDAVGRTVAVLRCLVDHAGEPVGVRAVAGKTSISRSAVQRILARLADLGLAVVDEDGRYLTGPLLLELASGLVSQSSLIQTADIVMRQLVDEFDESAYLTVLIPDEDRISFVHVVECNQRIRYIVPIGSGAPLHAGAAGKAVLAWMNRDDNLGDLEAYTLETVTDPKLLQEDLELIRERGYAVSTGERIEGASGIAAPVFLDGRVIGSISVAVPRSRLRAEDMPVLGVQVSEKAKQLSRMLAGYGKFQQAARVIP